MSAHVIHRYLRRPAVIYIGEVGRTVDRIKQVVVFVKGDADKKYTHKSNTHIHSS